MGLERMLTHAAMPMQEGAEVDRGIGQGTEASGQELARNQEDDDEDNGDDRADSNDAFSWHKRIE